MHSSHQRGAPATPDSQAPATFPRLQGSTAAAAATVAGLFLIYELIRRQLLLDPGTWRVHVYHSLNGFALSFAATVVASWLILRGSWSPFGESLLSEQAPARGPDRELHFAEWFIRMRWVAVVVASVLAFVSIGILGYLSPDLWTPLIRTVLVLALLNAIYTAVLTSRRWTAELLIVQAYGDLIILTVLLHFSGGIENPLTMVMFFHVIIAGIVLSRNQCYAVAAAASVLFTTLALVEWLQILPHYTLAAFPHEHIEGGVLHAARDEQYVLSRIVLHSTVLFLTAFFATTVSGQLRRDERQLEAYADRVLAQTQLLEGALDSTGTALCVKDRELQPTWSNDRWHAAFGAAPPAAECPIPEDGAEAARLTLGDGQIRVTELDLGERAANGAGAATSQGNGRHHTTYLLTTAPLHDKTGAIAQVVQLARDVTDQKELHARLVRTEKLAAIGELAGRVAHEVNNPIAVVSAKARLLLSDHRQEFSQHTAIELGKITELADRVARIAQGLLSYCRPSPGLARAVDVRSAIRRALELVEPSARAAGVVVDQRMTSDLPMVHANAAELEQVFLNLFVNALDAMPRGGRLVIRAASVPPLVEISVEDTGHGIPDEIRSRLFEPFLTTKADGQGTGLGLSICHGLMTSNGGTIDLDSTPGRGTRVRLTLPVERVSAAANQEEVVHG